MKTLRILGIDPGSYTNGFSLVEVDLETFKITSIYTTLIDVSDIVDRSTFKNHIYVRLKELTRRTCSLMNYYKPDIVSVEAGFMSHLRPQAYGVLSKTMYAIVMGIMTYDHLMNIEEFAPKVAKKLIGVGDIDKKESTEEALLRMEEITSLIDITVLSEHEIDAISLVFPIIEKFKNIDILPIK